MYKHTHKLVNCHAVYRTAVRQDVQMYRSVLRADLLRLGEIRSPMIGAAMNYATDPNKRPGYINLSLKEV